MPLIHDAETWQRKLAALPLKSFRADETVLAAGTRTGQLLILKSGAVSVSRGGTTIATVSEPGAVFGEMSVLLDQPHAADVRTLEASQFHVADAVALMANDSAALLYVAMVLARRVDLANHALLELKRELATVEPVGLLDATIDKIQGLLGVIGEGYLRAGAGVSMFPPG